MLFGTPKHCIDEEAGRRVPWRGAVRILEDYGEVYLEGLELGRTSVIARGIWSLAVGRTVTVELEVLGQRVQVLATVAAREFVGGIALVRLDLEASSPVGNDLIADAVRAVHTQTVAA